METVIRTVGLTKCYGREAVLDRLDLNVSAGGIHGLVGANGAGKTTLFRVLLGFLAPTAGQAQVLGRDSRDLTAEDRGRVAFVDEQHCLPGLARVGRLADMARRLHRGWSERTFQLAMAGWDLPVRRRISELSRGQRAAFNLALNLARSPDLLLLDEPTLGLDSHARRNLLGTLLYSEPAARSTVIYCSHHLDEVERVADSLIVLDRGRLRIQGSPEEICSQVSHWTSDIPFKGPETSQVPGLLQVQRIDGLHHHIVLGQKEDFAGFLHACGARNVARKDVDLETALQALMGHRGLGCDP